MKNSALAKAVLLPAVLVLGFGGSALVAAPAFADVAPPTPAAVSTPAPSASAVPTSTPTSTATPTPTSTATPTPAPTQAKAAAVPTDLTLTSPVSSNDFDTVTVHGAREFTIEGSAPIGSALRVTDSDGNTVARLTTTTTTFSIPVTFTDQDGYDQYISVLGKSGTKQLTEWDFEVVFDADQSATPTITTPTSGNGYEASPAPFTGNTPNDVVRFSGTGTPGEDIMLVGANPADGQDGGFFFGGAYDEIVVGDDGTWSGGYYVEYGTTTVTAEQVVYSDQDDWLTVPSDDSNAVAFTVTAPAGTVAPPVITAPSDPNTTFSLDGYGIGVTTYSFSDVQKTRLRPAETQQGKVRDATVRRDYAAETTSTRGLKTGARILTPLIDAAKAADDGDPSFFDDFMSQFALKVHGTANAATPGKLDMTVSGTGTPGDGIVVYQEKVEPALDYVLGLYPTILADQADGDPTPLEPVSGAPRSVPAALTTGDPAATSTLPAYDGKVVVAVDGTWSTTISRAPGDYLLTTFDVADATTDAPRYSVASAVQFVRLSGTPAVAPAAVVVATAPTELAFTGSDPSAGLGLGAGVLAAGASLLLIGVRRHRTIR